MGDGGGPFVRVRVPEGVVVTRTANLGDASSREELWVYDPVVAKRLAVEFAVASERFETGKGLCFMGTSEA